MDESNCGHVGPSPLDKISFVDVCQGTQVCVKWPICVFAHANVPVHPWILVKDVPLILVRALMQP